MESVEYSIVVPVYNSEGTLNSLFERVQKLFCSLQKTFQVIFVDDDSSDRSWNRINNLRKEHPDQVKGIRLSKNSGQQNATLCGIHHSDGSYIVTIDDDLQIPPEEIRKLISRHDETGAELVYGLYERKKHSIIRNLGSLFVQKFFRYFANTSGQGSSFRLITRNLANNLTTLNQKYLLLDEVLNWYTDSINYQDVEHVERPNGKSGYSLVKLVVITINYVMYYTIIPLRLMTYIGFFFSLASFIFGVIYIYNRLMREVELGFTSLIVAIFFSTSIILFSLGIIGEYISRIYAKESSMPQYIIKEMSA